MASLKRASFQKSVSSHPLIEIRGLSKSFVEGEVQREVLQAVDLQIDRGAFVVLIGQSGSGKSTLLNLISGIDRPDRGEVLVDGTDITALSETERTRFRREHIGVVFQSFNLIPTLNVRENVLLPLELAGKASPDRSARAMRRLEQVGLGDRNGTFPDKLSGGEQQRVAIARALSHDPPLVLADEPTGNLDAETGRDVLHLFQRLVRDTGSTLLIATHDTVLADQADRVIQLHQGRITDVMAPQHQEEGVG